MSVIGRIGHQAMGLAAVALSCLGCVSAAERLQQWEDRPVSELVARRGPADRIVGYPYGGRLFIWEEERNSSASADASGKRPAVGERQETRVYREIALVGDDGRIVRTHVENGVKGSSPSF